MPPSADYLAIDLGASSGRAVLGTLDGARLTLREVHRFPNGPIERPTGLHWDVPRLFDEIKRSISLAAQASPKLTGIGIDTWGVDYALLSESGQVLDLPHHYRDPRTRGLMNHAFTLFPRERIYSRTGIQFMPINTLYQLLADQRDPRGLLGRAHALLFMPDLFNFWLTGLIRSERTIASTSQLFDPGANVWATDLISALGLPDHILPPVVAPSTPLGPLLPEFAQASVGTTVIAPASHDTASAVAAIPATGKDWAYISSGTWSLVGRELTTPIRTPEALAANFTNECGLEGTIRFHKNIAGLWLLQECQRAWSKESGALAVDQVLDLARAAPPFSAIIDPDHASFALIGDDMPERVSAFCRRTGQNPPDWVGAIVRCILESLAIKTAIVLSTLESLTGPVRRVHIVGGGVQNPLLLQFTADATARPVLAGPVEATAAGNIMSQALSLGQVASLEALRAVIHTSFQPTEYSPRSTAEWRRAVERFRSLPVLAP